MLSHIMARYLALLFLFLILPVSAAPREQILNYDVDIQVKKDGTLNITEIIKVRAQRKQIKRGIYRDFPHILKGKWGVKRKLPFEVIKVTKNGKPELVMNGASLF